MPGDLAGEQTAAGPSGSRSESAGLSPIAYVESWPILEFGLRLGAARNRLLLLDYDGTLAPFRIERMEAVPYPGVREVLSRIMHFGGRVIVISGRPAGEVDQLLALPVRPEIWGCHGWERLHPDGRMERFPMSKLQSEGIARVDFLLTREGLTGQLEKKYGSIALHWRGMGEEQISDLRSTGLRAMEPVVNESLGLRRFDGGLELRALGRDKGTAVQAILDEAGDSFGAVYLGDDATDEDAFNAISGMGLGVLVRPEHRRSAASVWLKPPDELLGFLMLWEDLTSGKFFNR